MWKIKSSLSMSSTEILVPLSSMKCLIWENRKLCWKQCCSPSTQTNKAKISDMRLWGPPLIRQTERNRRGCSEGTALQSPLIREYIPLSTQWRGPASEGTEDAACFPFSARRRFHHPIILHLHVRSSVLLFMLIGIGCFGLWHRHLALAVNCSFLSHLAKKLKPAIFWVRIRHLKKNVHIGKPLRSVEWKKGAGRGMGGYRPHCGVTWFQR